MAINNANIEEFIDAVVLDPDRQRREGFLAPQIPAKTSHRDTEVTEKTAGHIAT